MKRIDSLAENLVLISGSPEKAAEEAGVSVATISRWRTGKSIPRAQQERKLRQLVQGDITAQSALALEGPDQHVRTQIENVIRTILNDFRETIHRYGSFNHRNDSLDFLAKILFAHITDKADGGQGISQEMVEPKSNAAKSLRDFVELRLKKSLPDALSYELNDLGKALKISLRDNDFAVQIVNIFIQPVVDDVLSSLVRTHQFDIINDIFGRFVTDSFVEEKELAQYLTPPEIVKLMARIGANSLSEKHLKDLHNPKGEMMVLDPSCGVGSFLIEAIHTIKDHAQIKTNNTSLHRRIVGIDKSERMAQLAITNLSLLGIKKANVILGNALDKNADVPFNNFKGKVALILTNPPFGASFGNQEIGEYDLFSAGDRRNGKIDSELLFLERYIEWLSPGGILVAIVPDSVLTNQGTFKHARKLIEKTCDVLSVISLPPVTFAAAGTTTKTSILHIRKKDNEKSKSNNKIYFSVCDSVGYEVVTRGSQRRKVITEKNDLPQILMDQKNSDSPSHGKIITLETLDERWDAKYHLSMSSHLDGGKKSGKLTPVGQLADLISEKIDPRRLGSGEFKYIEISDVDERLGMVWYKTLPVDAAPSRARKLVKSGDVLVSTVRPERGCIGVVPPHLDGAICSTGFAVLRPKEINPYLLVFLLKSSRVISQIERHMSGIAYPSINESIVPDLLVNIDTKKNKDLCVSALSYQHAIEKLCGDFDDISTMVQ